VIKRFRSWSQGEHEREWRALTLLAEYAPGLAPLPVKADLAGDPPTVVMSRLEGAPLVAPVTPEQIDALIEAITTVQQAIPQSLLANVPPRAGHPSEMADLVRAWCAQRPRLGPDPLVARAFDAGVEWLARLDSIVETEAAPVFGLGDGNLANYLWDGSRVRLVDFEYSGRSDRAYELAEAAEHVSMWVNGAVEAPSLLSHFDLTTAEAARLRDCRRLLAFYWFHVLLPERSRHSRNPPGTLERQATRLLALLG
jgi:hypothetical protein